MALVPNFSFKVQDPVLRDIGPQIRHFDARHRDSHEVPGFLRIWAKNYYKSHYRSPLVYVRYKTAVFNVWEKRRPRIDPKDPNIPPYRVDEGREEMSAQAINDDLKLQRESVVATNRWKENSQ